MEAEEMGKLWRSWPFLFLSFSSSILGYYVAVLVGPPL